MSADISERYGAIEARVQQACTAAGRERTDVRLLAVSKRQPLDAVRELASLGVRDFGENHIQAWAERRELLADLPLRWHLIGPCQTNKAKLVARGRPTLLHTVDRPSLVDALASFRAHLVT